MQTVKATVELLLCSASELLWPRNNIILQVTESLVAVPQIYALLYTSNTVCYLSS